MNKRKEGEPYGVAGVVSEKDKKSLF